MRLSFSRSPVVGDLAVAAMPWVDAQQIENIPFKGSVTATPFKGLPASWARHHGPFYRRGCDSGWHGAGAGEKEKGRRSAPNPGFLLAEIITGQFGCNASQKWMPLNFFYRIDHMLICEDHAPFIYDDNPIGRSMASESSPPARSAWHRCVSMPGNPGISILSLCRSRL